MHGGTLPLIFARPESGPQVVRQSDVTWREKRSVVKTVLAFISWFGVAVCGVAAVAAAPEPWGIHLQDPASPIMHEIYDFHTMLVWIISVIVAFVVVLLLYVMVRFRAGANPIPSKTAHNSLVEFAWTLLPVIVLIGIAIPSFKLLYHADRAADAEMSIKAIGRQWYWSYEYPDANAAFTFDSTLIAEKDLKPGQKRLLEVDEPLVLPVDTTIRVLTTGGDVIHSFAMPSLGLKLDAVPGRLNETWVRIEREGMYYGQCSEICGVGHAYMPIAIKAVSKADYAIWRDAGKKKYTPLETAAPAQPAK